MHTTTFDFSPLYRSTVGFDRLSRMFETGFASDQSVAYPPYNIVKLTEQDYRITMAVAGFTEKDIDIVSKENQLTVSGQIGASDAKKDITYLHRGIAERTFERKFQLADHIKVVNASLENGLLSIDLVHEVPDEMKPRKIEIRASGSAQSPMIDGKKTTCSSC